MLERLALTGRVPPHPARTGRLHDRVHRGARRRGGEAAIVDTGVAGSAQRIGEVVQDAGQTWDAVRHLILTHHHLAAIVGPDLECCRG
jgi:glyoxylase-like metal-dependent hydrolase (beta-lactamase superfamily II)